MSASTQRRGSILVEDAVVLEHRAFEGDQYILRVSAPRSAARALPGQFAHLTCDPALPMRRPLSIMRVDAAAGWMDFLYKIVGTGSRMLSQRGEGDVISMLAPIGQPFELHENRRRPLLIGGGVGIPPMVFLADYITNRASDWRPLVLMGSEIPFPFTLRPSSILIDGMADGAIASMPLLEDWGVPCRLATLQGYSGCYDGYVTDLARVWLGSLGDDALDDVEVFACGPTPMLRAAAQVAAEFGLPCQVSLEEHMACAVGGCAGCTVLVQTDAGPAMKRVCVDGPVFDAYSVFPPAA